ncbi:uncharacterized protein LOC117333705 [Pecten maximus]|uniref:uncharacterized protein LOC117333705 n=1 Tax=Pecten maximus TaxID=6579 RepID=UPI001458978B|nr:uncharacterized protein LOC117333705 [Pecten maximus]
MTVKMEKVQADMELRVLLDVSENLKLSNNTDGHVIVRQVSSSELHVNVNVLDKESGIKDIFVGAGSTRGGFQIHQLVPVPSSSNILLFTEALHGQEVYITAIVENHAGDRSHFHSRSVIMDHTPPIISNAMMTMTYKSSAEYALTQVNVTWEVKDTESSTVQCSCVIVDDANGTIIDGIISSPKRCYTPPLPLMHGTMISALVNCYNDANLGQIASVGPELVAYLPPDVKNAKIFFSTSVETSDGLPIVRPSSSLIFSWEGIDDSFGIKSYSYRILHGGQVAKDWEDTETRSYVSVEDVSLTDNGLYSVEVTANNYAGIYSKTINASVLVLGEAPSLTDQLPQISRTDEIVDVSWVDVFSVRPELQPTYSVTIGSEEGLADIVRRMNIKEQRHVFHNMYSGNDAFVIITCTYNTGTTSVFRAKVSIS